MKRIYLDYAATTPVDPRVFKAMQPYFAKTFGNPSSIHSFGQEALSAVDAARESLASALQADFREIIFTGSATEANNLALRGVLARAKEETKFQIPNSKFIPRIIISAIEHESVRETAYDLARHGADVVEIPVNSEGVVNLKKLKAALDERTVLVSIIYANNEIGTIQPIAEIAKVIQNWKLEIKNWKLESEYPLLHTDAVQAFQFLDCTPPNLGVDLMTLSAHKIYGPKGIGALYIRNQQQETRDKKISSLRLVSDSLSPIIAGGGQEFGIRSGTENTASIAGFAKAAELAVDVRKKETSRIRDLRDYFWRKLRAAVPKVQLTVPYAQKEIFLPNILNIHFPLLLAEELITALDLKGIAVSAGSACRSRAMQTSHVIEALGVPRDRARRSFRISLGRFTTKTELDKAAEIFVKILGAA